MPVVIPIHKLQGIRVVSCHCPEPFIALEIETSDGAVTSSYDQGLTPDLLYVAKGQTAHTVRHLLVKHVLVVLNVYNHLLLQGKYKSHHIKERDSVIYAKWFNMVTVCEEVSSGANEQHLVGGVRVEPSTCHRYYLLVRVQVLSSIIISFIIQLRDEVVVVTLW